MPTASLSSDGVGFAIPALSHTVITNVKRQNHKLCVPRLITNCDTAFMAGTDKNAGPNFLRAWREFNDMTQEELAEAVGTNQNMIAYLESGERGLSAKWLRRLAPALKTTPGHLLDHDPRELDADIIDIWTRADQRQRRQLTDIARAIVKTGTER